MPCQYFPLSNLTYVALENPELKYCLQIIWKSIQTVNCGISKSKDGILVLVCQYDKVLKADTIKSNILSLPWKSFNSSQEVHPFNFTESPLQLKVGDKKTFRMQIFLTKNTVDYKNHQILELSIQQKKEGTATRAKLCGTESELSKPETKPHKVSNRFVENVFTFETFGAGLGVYFNNEIILSTNFQDAGVSQDCLNKWKILAKTNSNISLFSVTAEAGSAWQYRSLPASSDHPSDSKKVIFKKDVDFSNSAPGFSYNAATEMFVFTTEEAGKEEKSENETENKETDEDSSSSEAIDHNRHYEITDKEGNIINVVFPKIKTTFMDNHNGSVKVWLDRSEDFEGVSKFQLIVQHFNQDQAPEDTKGRHFVCYFLRILA